MFAPKEIPLEVYLAQVYEYITTIIISITLYGTKQPLRTGISTPENALSSKQTTESAARSGQKATAGM